MGSGGITGRPIPVNGTATTTVTPVTITSPYRRGIGIATPPVRETFLRALTVTNLDATNNLLVFINGSTVGVVVKPNLTSEFEGLVHSLAVQSSAATVAYSGVGIAA